MSAREAKRGVNSQYFAALLRDRKISTRKLAKLMRMHQASLVRSFNGKRVLQTDEAAKLSSLLNVPFEDILKNLDIEVPLMKSAKGGKVPVTGSTSAGKVSFGKVAGPRAVQAPPNQSGAGMQALRCNDYGPFEEAYFYYKPAADVQPHAIGKLCVCVVAGGATYLATPKASTTHAGGYTLRDLAGNVLADNVWLESASPIVWIRTATD